jgi:hypothetical protein
VEPRLRDLWKILNYATTIASTLISFCGKVIDNEEMVRIEFEINKRQRDCGSVDQKFESWSFVGGRMTLLRLF